MPRPPHTHGGTDAPECTTCNEVLTDIERVPSREGLEPGQVWVWMSGPGEGHWEVRGTGVSLTERQEEMSHYRQMAAVFDEGMKMGSSRAMRKMSDEPDLPLATREDDNPYWKKYLELKDQADD